MIEITPRNAFNYQMKNNEKLVHYNPQTVVDDDHDDDDEIETPNLHLIILCVPQLS